MRLEIVALTMVVAAPACGPEDASQGDRLWNDQRRPRPNRVTQSKTRHFCLDVRGLMRRIVYGLLAIFLATGWGTTLSASAQSMAAGDRSNAAAPGYGGAVAVSDGDVLVGEAGNMIGPGAVYVYRKGSEGWEEVARLHASNGYRGDGFGTAIAVDGGTMLVSTRPQAQIDGSAASVRVRAVCPGELGRSRPSPGGRRGRRRRLWDLTGVQQRRGLSGRTCPPGRRRSGWQPAWPVDR